MDLKLEIKINDDKKLKLTEQEAKDLYTKLDELFGEKNSGWDWYNDPNTFSIILQDMITNCNGTGGLSQQPLTTDTGGNIGSPLLDTSSEPFIKINSDGFGVTISGASIITG